MISKKKLQKFFFSLGSPQMNIKNRSFYNNKDSYALIMELSTYLLKRKYFYNQIKTQIPYGVYNSIQRIKRQRLYPFIFIILNHKYDYQIHSFILLGYRMNKIPYKIELAHFRIDLACKNLLQGFDTNCWEPQITPFLYPRSRRVHASILRDLQI